jgi:hypothetical protein
MMLGALAAVAVLADGAASVANLAWMAGTWAEEKPGVVVREMWLAPRDGVMAGATQTNRDGRPPRIEFASIRATADGAEFRPVISGQDPVAFRLLPGADGEAVFENKAHDFPQRVIYRRCGEDLCASIEGTIDGKLQRQAWRYRRVK